MDFFWDAVSSFRDAAGYGGADRIEAF